MGALKTFRKNKLTISDHPFLSHISPGAVDAALVRFLSGYLAQYGTAFSAHKPLGVAYSGGADSTALLLAALRHWPGEVCALHIHHGLQKAGDDFLQHCEQQCKVLQIPLYVRHVQAQNAPGESPEDAARNSRYQALAAMAQEQQLESVLLAQHANDQVETLLLALSRGAGLPGLASMPAIFERYGVQFARPVLTAGAEELRQWLQDHHIPWVEDPTNQDRRYTRNRIRLEVIPAIAHAFPGYRQTFARSAAHAAQAQEILEEVAVQDLQLTGQPPVIKSLQNLSQARQANALRYWLKQIHGTAASTRQMTELLSQITACTTRAHQIHIKIGRGEITLKAMQEGAVLHFHEVLIRKNPRSSCANGRSNL